MSVVSRSVVALRRLVTRRPWVYWVVVLAVALLLASLTSSNLAAVDDARRSWGETAAVWVATGPLEPGDDLAAGVTRRHVPLAMVPDAAIGAVEGVVRQRVAAGEIVTEPDVSARTDQLALVPADWVVAAVTESPPSGAAPGHPVWVVADGVVLSSDALVVGAIDGATLVAVPHEVAPLVPLAAESGSLSLLRVP